MLLLYVGAFAISLIVGIIALGKINGTLRWHFTPKPKSMIYIPIGLAVMFLSTIVFPMVFESSSALFLGLAAITGILSFQLYRTESIVVPWITHAIYNAAFVAMAALGVSISPILFIPNFFFDGVGHTDLTAQIILQVIFVAGAEELTRVSVAMAVITGLMRTKMVGIGISAFLWLLLHLVLLGGQLPTGLPQTNLIG